MKTPEAVRVAQWLHSCDHIKNVKPVIVQIGHRSFSAAHYTKRRRKFLYILGELPPFHDRRRVCYRTDGSEDDWHLHAWQRTNCTEWREVHPIVTGSHFILAHWSQLDNWAADQCGQKPYTRLPMTVTEIGPPLSNQHIEEKGQQ
jgi:hypothetical protein